MRSQIALYQKSQAGFSLFLVLTISIVVVLIIMSLFTISGSQLVDSVRGNKRQKEFFLADGGFNLIQSRIAILNKEFGADSVITYLSRLKADGTQELSLSGGSDGYFRLDEFTVSTNPLSVDLKVSGSVSTGFSALRPASIEGIVRVPSLAKYFRYMEGLNTLKYKAGIVDGEVLAASKIELTEPLVHFTRLVSSGDIIDKSINGQFDFGFREKETALPTLDGIHVNMWDTDAFDPKAPGALTQTLANKASVDGIVLFPEWWGNNGNNECSVSKLGKCDTLFSNCYHPVSETKRTSIITAGSAIAINLDEVIISGGNVQITARPVLYDRGSMGIAELAYGMPKVFTRPLNSFKSTGVIYFPGDIYLTGTLQKISVTVVSGDDVFLTGRYIGSGVSAKDYDGKPVVLGVIAQDQIFIHEYSTRKMDVRAALLAENDEIIFKPGPNTTSEWNFGYVCKRETFLSGALPAPFSETSFSAFMDNYYIWDDRRTQQSGFAREPDEECLVSDCSSTNSDLAKYGFAVLAYQRLPATDPWKLTITGSLITRNPGSKGPDNGCTLGWDCDSELNRVTWNYDQNLSVVNPPSFPAPQVGDKIPAQVIGYKQRTFK